MIRIEDCEAFCDAEPGWVGELAARECLPMVMAYASAHAKAECSRVDGAAVGAGGGVDAAREGEFVPRREGARVLRDYGKDAAKSRARVLAMAALADGRLTEREVEKGATGSDACGVSEGDFTKALFDFCEDASVLLEDGSYALPEEEVRLAMEEAGRGGWGGRVARGVFEMACADGELSGEEEDMFWDAVNGTGATFDEIYGRSTFDEIYGRSAVLPKALAHGGGRA